jgi:uncharacterized protein
LYRVDFELNEETMREAEGLVSRGRHLSGSFYEPEEVHRQRPGLLFVHGLKSSQAGYVTRAQAATTQLGSVCLTFDLGGHGASEGDLDGLSARDHLQDCRVALDALAQHPQVDRARLGICGASYGAYLSAMVASSGDVTRLLLRAPAIYADAALDLPTGRRGPSDPSANADALFEGLARSRADVLVLESELDEVIPHSVIERYLQGCPNARHEVLLGAAHGLTDPAWEHDFVDAVTRWFGAL